MNHTPGSWILFPADYNGTLDDFELFGCCIHHEDGGQIIALAMTATTQENITNARLVAAAPDLYHALQQCLHAMNHDTDASNFTAAKRIAENALGLVNQKG